MHWLSDITLRKRFLFVGVVLLLASGVIYLMGYYAVRWLASGTVLVLLGCLMRDDKTDDGY